MEKTNVTLIEPVREISVFRPQIKIDEHPGLFEEVQRPPQTGKIPFSLRFHLAHGVLQPPGIGPKAVLVSHDDVVILGSKRIRACIQNHGKRLPVEEDVAVRNSSLVDFKGLNDLT